MSINLFNKNRLPKKPYCADNLSGLQIRSLSHAIKKRHIQHNDPTRIDWLVYDVDYEGAAYAWDGVCAEPNITVVNPINGKAHLLYCLDVPVYLQGNSRLAPIKYAAAVDAAYTDLLGADRGYVGLMCKNPLHEHWRVLEGYPWPYDLSELASWIPADQLARYNRKKRTMQQGLGRNCSLFNELRLWAYSNINLSNWISQDAWTRSVGNKAQQINSQFHTPLAYNEVQAVVRSVAKWVWKELRGGSQEDYIERTHTSSIQSARGRKSGEARRKGTPLEHDRKPWVANGVSRSTWYRRQRLLKSDG